MLTTIVGKRGKGKTSLAKQLIRESKADRIFIFDYIGEYCYLPLSLKHLAKKLFIMRVNLKSFCLHTWKLSSKKTSSLVVFDEVDLYGKNNRQIEWIFRYGRHKNIDIISVSRRFYDLPVFIRALTEEFCLFQITEERDLNYLRRYMNKKNIETIINLKDYEYIKLTF